MEEKITNFISNKRNTHIVFALVFFPPFLIAALSILYDRQILAELASVSATSDETVYRHIIEKVFASQMVNTLGIFILLGMATAGWFFVKLIHNYHKRVVAQLNEARQNAEHSRVLEEQFMANMSHEIRTPLNAIIGFTKLLQRTKLQGNQTEFVGSIHSAGENLMSIVNDILDFSKIQAGALRLESVNFHLPGLVDSLRAMFEYKANEKGLDFKVELHPQLPEYLNGDPTRLTQILVNLLGNAFKFTDSGFVKLEVLAAPALPQKTKITFRVEDSGIGIPEGQEEKIFDRFSQGSADSTRKYGGTGLGLSITKQLVELQGGTIEVEQKRRVGAAFQVVIPYQISVGNGRHPDDEDAALPLEGLTPADICILLVEDNLANQRIAEFLLAEWGFRHEHAANGQIALEKLPQQKFDLVLMDIQMPVMDGYTAARLIRSQLHLDVPIIATTAHALAGEKERCIGNGMNDYLSKPLNEVELLHLILQYVHISKDKIRNLDNPEFEPLGSTGQEEDIPGFNRAYVMELSRGKTEILQKMSELFIVQASRELNSMEQALEEANFDKIASLAHNMKSTVSYMGFEAVLGQQLRMLENEAKENPSVPGLRHLFEEIKNGTEQAIGFINQKFWSPS